MLRGFGREGLRVSLSLWSSVGEAGLVLGCCGVCLRVTMMGMSACIKISINSYYSVLTAIRSVLHVLHFLPLLLLPLLTITRTLLLGLVVLGCDVVPQPSQAEPGEVYDDEPV